jgi:hypothetical protein
MTGLLKGALVGAAFVATGALTANAAPISVPAAPAAANSQAEKVQYRHRHHRHHYHRRAYRPYAYGGYYGPRYRYRHYRDYGYYGPPVGASIGLPFFSLNVGPRSRYYYDYW